MRAVKSPIALLLPLFVAALVAALGAGGAGLGRVPTSAPGVWLPLATDGTGECAAEEEGRDGREAFWAIESGMLHLRLCAAGTPGWRQTPEGWSEARYKWGLATPSGRYLLLLEDAAPPADPGGALLSDGRGDLTLLDDANGNGRFSDEWAGAWPPGYLDNQIGSPRWRRVSAAMTGPGQRAGSGDIGFALGSAPCGPVVDVYVRLAAIGTPSRVCVQWVTDPEEPDLDVRPACDTGPAAECLAAVGASPSPRDPASATPGAISASATPTASSTQPSTSRSPTPTASQKPTDVKATATLPPSPSPTGQAATAPVTSTTAATAPPPATATPAVATPPAPSPSASVVGPMEPSPTKPGTASIPASATPTASPGSVIGSPTATPGATAPTPTVPVTPETPSAIVCVHAVIGGLAIPFPEPATVHAVLLTPFGWPAKPVESRAPGPDGCVRFLSLEPGQYRVWVSVPVGWQPYPGTPGSQTLWITAGQIGPVQMVFRFMAGIGSAPVIVPSPPGPPALTPGVVPPTVAPTSAAATPYPASPERPAVGSEVLLPVLGYLGNDAVCDAWVEAQNIGDRPAKALLLLWGDPGFCPPQCAGPLKVECSGLLAPGSAWNFLGDQMPNAARSGLVISANADRWGEDFFADALCETLFRQVVGDCDAYRRFRKAYAEQGVWSGFDFGAAPTQPMAVEVLRDCPGDVRPEVRVTSSYAAVAAEYLGRWDPVYGGHAVFAPSLLAGRGGFTSILYLQNAGVECTSVELWFQSFEECLAPRVCDILTLAPGETQSFDASACMPSGWSGSAWVRSSQPLAVTVDHVGNDVLMTYSGVASELNYVWNGEPLYTAGSAVAYGPLVYSEYQGWDTAVVVQNLSRVTAAKVKVYFLDRSGSVVVTLVDWVCPGGAQTFFLPVLANLPGNWVGSVRVESQDWFAAGGPSVSAPNVAAVAHLIQYGDIARTEPHEALAYNLFPEQLAYDWSLGSGAGGLTSGIGRIGIPSFLKDRRGTGVTSEISIANVVVKPGLTNFAIFVYDQNGLIDYLCETLNESQVEYINLDSWGFIHPGFKGSALISATFWEHEVFDGQGGFTRNVVGLAAVKVERSGTTLGNPIPGDESAGNEAFPVPGPFRFSGPAAPACPGWGGGGRIPSPPAAPTPTPAPARPTATSAAIPSPPGPPIP